MPDPYDHDSELLETCRLDELIERDEERAGRMREQDRVAFQNIGLLTAMMLPDPDDRPEVKLERLEYELRRDFLILRAKSPLAANEFSDWTQQQLNRDKRAA